VRKTLIPDCPPVLDPAGSAGAEERRSAIEHFADAGSAANESAQATPFKFEAYRDPTVREALKAAFGGLCAYCESPTEATAPIDVEHYRPKGAVRTETERLSHGYYWLAATWENLLPSCIRCNRAEGYDYEDNSRRTSGKGSWFPLADEAARARSEGREDGESPLLLHPYYDDPAEHLEFGEDGVVIARRKANGERSRRGAKTIEVLGLNRPGLLNARRAHLRSVEAHRKRLLRAERMLRRYPQDEDALEQLEEARRESEDLVRRGAMYSALAAERLGVRTPAGSTPTH
jgi:uncharacterized protein (TIGR02646 family)